MIPVMYPLGTGSKLNNLELRFSLRSIDKHLSNYGDIIIIGEKPPWIQNVIHIPHPDEYSIPDYNIMSKTRRAFADVDKLLFFNDDHYLLQDFDAENFPFFYSSTLEEYVKRRGLDGYGKRARNSLQHLKSKNLPTKYFDTHTPITYERDPFFENVVSLPWEKSKEGFVIKSLYANALKIEGVEEKDCKTIAPPRSTAKVFSTTSKPRYSVQRFLLDTFPKKSKYEK